MHPFDPNSQSRQAGYPTAPAGQRQVVCLPGSFVFRDQRAAWQSLLACNDAQLDYPSAFGNTAWLDAWGRTLGADLGFFTFLNNDAHGWRAVLPLMQTQVKSGKLRFSCLSLASWPELDNFEIPAIGQADRLALCRDVLDYSRRKIPHWKALYIREIANNGPTHRAFRDACQEAGWNFHQEIKARTPVLNIEEFFAGEDPRSKSERYRITKFRRKLAKLGAVKSSFELVQADALPRFMQDCKDVEAASWKASSTVQAGYFQSPERLKFVRRLWQNLVDRNQLAASVLRLNGKAVAVHWGLLDGQRFLSYYCSFVQEFHTSGSGSVLLDDMIAASPELGIKLFDASRGGADGRHILGRYGCPMREQIEFIAYRPGVSGHALRWVRESLMPRLRRLRHKD